ncbi:Sperm-associated antigen 1, partial [Araneus ventricosus]
LSAAEREHIANLERIKGNEAFKAQDYEEAALYYTRSLSAFRTAKTLNNRAQTHLKLKNYLEAVIDCNEVISMEPNNIKALYRRGIAHKEAKMFDLAVIDFGIILRLEPENKSARDQLEQIENSLIQKPQEKRKVIIEELESETGHNNESDESTFDTQNEDTSKRLAIEEITESPRQILDDICNCHVTDDDTRPLSKSTKEMLSIFKNNDGSMAHQKTKKVTFEETENQLS